MTAQPYDANDVLMGGGGAPTAKFDQPGTTIGGTIVAPPRSHQEREYDPRNPGQGKPKVFPSGDPIMGITVDVQTNLRDPSIDEDTGVRRIYVEGKRLKDAIRDAVRANGPTCKLLVGGELYVTFTGLGVASGAGINPPKEYTAKYTPPEQAAIFGQQAQQPPAWAQAPVAPPQQQPDTWAAQQNQQPPAQPAPPQQTVATEQGQVNTATGEISTGPTAEQVAAVKAAGLDPATVFPGYTGG